MATGVYFILFLAALPLLAYPAVFLAGMMALANVSKIPEGASVSLLAVSGIFYLGSLAYPACFLYFAGLARSRLKSNDSIGALKVGAMPLGYLALLAVDTWLWRGMAQ